MRKRSSPSPPPPIPPTSLIFSKTVSTTSAPHGKVEVQLAGRPFQIKREFLDDIAEHGLMAHVAKLHKALLIMHSPTDDTVGIENATNIFMTAKHPKSFVSLSGADHLLSAKRDSAYVADVIAAWVERYVEPGRGRTGRSGSRRAAQRRGTRDPRQQVPADGHVRPASIAGR